MEIIFILVYAAGAAWMHRKALREGSGDPATAMMAAVLWPLIALAMFAIWALAKAESP